MNKDDLFVAPVFYNVFIEYIYPIFNFLVLYKCIIFAL